MTADQTKAGSDWQSDELDAIVADYFDMLTADISGRPYVKSRHRAALIARIGRTQGSIEFKHQNISAVLDELGMPWILGYKPAKNYQNAIFDAIDRYLSQNPKVLEFAPHQPARPSSPQEIFVPTPVLAAANEPIPERLRRLVQKFDPVERDHRNRSLGKAGEAFVLDLERRLLRNADRPDLASKVRWTASEDGDGAGYDISSFHPQGDRRLIEVKTTNGSARTPFFLSRNERAVASERPEEWRIYRVHLLAQGPRVFTIAPPLENAVKLTAETWRASF
jgi:hypothetical protein